MITRLHCSIFIFPFNWYAILINHLIELTDFKNKDQTINIRGKIEEIQAPHKFPKASNINFRHHGNRLLFFATLCPSIHTEPGNLVWSPITRRSLRSFYSCLPNNARVYRAFHHPVSFPRHSFPLIVFPKIAWSIISSRLIESLWISFLLFPFSWHRNFIDEIIDAPTLYFDVEHSNNHDIWIAINIINIIATFMGITWKPIWTRKYRRICE